MVSLFNDVLSNQNAQQITQNFRSSPVYHSAYTITNTLVMGVLPIGNVLLQHFIELSTGQRNFRVENFY